MAPKPKPRVSGFDGGGSGETLTLSIIRGATGRKETLVTEGEVSLYKEDFDALREMGFNA